MFLPGRMAPAKVRYTNGLVPSDTPTVIILGTRPGAGKTELEKNAAHELGNNKFFFMLAFSAAGGGALSRDF